MLRAPQGLGGAARTNKKGDGGSLKNFKKVFFLRKKTEKNVFQDPISVKTRLFYKKSLQNARRAKHLKAFDPES